jgi:homoaconitate hydratase
MRQKLIAAVFPIDQTLERWLRHKATEAAIFDDGTTRQRINHKRIDRLFSKPLKADPDAVYAKQLYLDLSSLSPYVSGPNTPKVAVPLNELAPKNIRIDRA